MASIIKTVAGTFRVQVDNRGKREYKTFRTKTLATTWATQREGELERGLIASVDMAQRTAFCNVIEDYRVHVMPSKRGHHIKFTLRLLERQFEKLKLISITPRDVSMFRDERLSKGSHTESMNWVISCSAW